jgi:hypothetical protein
MSAPVMLIVLMARHPSVHPPHAYTKNDMKQIREQNSLNVNLTLGNLYTIQQKNAMSMHTAAKCTTSMFRYAQTKTQTKKKTNQKNKPKNKQTGSPDASTSSCTLQGAGMPLTSTE